jgi:H+/Cl- antiporter ClcA
VVQRERPPLVQHAYWIILARSAAIGLFGGVFGVVFLGVEHAARAALWGDLGESFDWFSGGVRSLIFPIIAGLIVGMAYTVLHLPMRLKSFLEEIEEGRADPKIAPRAVIVSLISLVGGASLGPEAPLVVGASGFGNWLTRRAGASVDETRTATFSGAAGALGGLMSSPFIGTLFAFELERENRMNLLFIHIIPGGISGIVAFVIVYPFIGSPFLNLYAFPEFEFTAWYLLAGAGIGVLGAVLGLVVGGLGKAGVRLATRIPGPPIVRGGVGGVIIAVIAFAMPATLFSGIDALGVVIDNTATFGVGLLVAVVGLKMVTVSASLATGFYGGPFFPMFFIGGTMGAVVHQLFPSFPLALAVGAAMAATAAIAGIPFSIVIIAVFVTGVGPPAAAVITIAVIVSISITYGLGIVGPWSVQAQPDGAETAPG